MNYAPNVGFYLLPKFKEKILQHFDSLQEIVLDLRAQILNPLLAAQNSISKWNTANITLALYPWSHTSTSVRLFKQPVALSDSL